MALSASDMATAMLNRAQNAGLVNAPPLFALSGIYTAIATGVVATLKSSIATIITVNWSGLLPTGASVATALGIQSLDPNRFYPLAQAEAGHIGPFAPAFYNGIGGVVEYLVTNTQFQELLCPVAAGGTGTLVSIVMDPDTCRDAIVAATPNIMKCDLPGGCPEASPRATLPATVANGDVYYEMNRLITATSNQLAIELLRGTQTTWVMTGAVFAPPTPVAGLTVTTRIL